MDAAALQGIQLLKDAGSVLAKTVQGDQARACIAFGARPSPADVAPKFSGSKFLVLQRDLPLSLRCVPRIIGYGAENRHCYGALVIEWMALTAGLIAATGNFRRTRSQCLLHPLGLHRNSGRGHRG